MIRNIQIVVRLLAVVTALWAISARADGTAGHLLNGCQKLDRSLSMQGDRIAFDQNFETIYCWGFMAAIQETTGFSDQRDVPLLGVCLPPETTLTQLIRIFIAWGNRNPQHLHKQAAGSVLASFVESFPCGKKP